MLERVVIAGYGGHGAMLIGKILATLASEAYEHVTYFPSYGSEVRGGTVHCSVIISDEEIASPVIEQADTVIAMSQESADRYCPILGPAGMAIVNSSLVRSAKADRVYDVPATEIAEQIGDARATNMVMLGAYLARRQLADLSAARKTLVAMLRGTKAKLSNINQTGLVRGFESQASDVVKA